MRAGRSRASTRKRTMGREDGATVDQRHLREVYALVSRAKQTL